MSQENVELVRRGTRLSTSGDAEPADLLARLRVDARSSAGCRAIRGREEFRRCRERGVRDVRRLSGAARSSSRSGRLGGRRSRRSAGGARRVAFGQRRSTPMYGPSGGEDRARRGIRRSARPSKPWGCGSRRCRRSTSIPPRGEHLTPTTYATATLFADPTRRRRGVGASWVRRRESGAAVRFSAGADKGRRSGPDFRRSRRAAI